MSIRLVLLVLPFLIPKISQSQGLDNVFKKLLRQNARDSIYIDSLLQSASTMNNSEPAKAIIYFEQAKQLSEAINYKRGIKTAINGIGNGHIVTGHFEEALRQHQQLLVLARASADSNHEFKALGNLAITYASLMNYDKALVYFRKSLALAAQNQHPMYGSICGNMGNLFKLTGQLDSAHHYLNLAISTGISNQDYRALAHGLFNLSDVKVQQGELYEALAHIDSALIYGRRIDSKIFEVMGQISRIEVLDQLGMGIAHMDELEKYLNIAEEHTYYQSLVSGYKLLANILIKNNQPIKALEAVKKGAAWEREVFNNEKSMQIEKLTAQFELDAKQKEIDIQNLQIAKQTYFLYIISCIALVAFLVALILYRYFVSKSKANKKLQQLNVQISQHREELMHRSNSLKKANEEINKINENLELTIAKRTQKIKEQNEKLVKYAFLSAHEIRGPLSSILGITGMLKDHPDDEALSKILPQLHDKSKDMDFVIKKMVTSLEEEIQLRPFNEKPTI